MEVAKSDLKNLLKSRKLVLLVDLDHTLIHTTDRGYENVEIKRDAIIKDSEVIVINISLVSIRLFFFKEYISL